MNFLAIWGETLLIYLVTQTLYPAESAATRTRPELMSPEMKFLTSAAAQGEAIGLSRWTIHAMRKASRGQPDSPFRGRLTTAQWLMEWINRHPEFVASHQYPRKLAPERMTLSPRPVAVDKYDAPSGRRARRTPSLELSVLPA